MDVSSAYSFVVEVIFFVMSLIYIKNKNGALWYTGLCVKEG